MYVSTPALLLLLLRGGVYSEAFLLPSTNRVHGTIRTVDSDWRGVTDTTGGLGRRSSPVPRDSQAPLSSAEGSPGTSCRRRDSTRWRGRRASCRAGRASFAGTSLRMNEDGAVDSSAGATSVEETSGEQQGEEEEDDPAKELAELVMEEMFEWNNEHEVIDAEIPWIDLEEVAEESRKREREMQALWKEMEERDRAAEALAEEEERVAMASAAAGEGDLRAFDGRFKQERDNEGAMEDEIQRPPPEVPNIFEGGYDDLGDEQVEFGDADARCVALARGYQHLYGFDRSQVRKEVLDAVEAAGDETRRNAYARLIAAVCSQPYQDNLRIARQFKWASRILLPRETGDLPGYSDRQITDANALGVKTLVNISDDYPRASRATTGGWCLWILKFLQNRDEGMEGHLPIDDETVGIFYNLRSQEEKDKSRLKAGARMFRQAISSEVFLGDTGGVLANRAWDQFRDLAVTMGQRILAIAGETVPAHGRAYDILREMTRELLDEMASIAYDKVLLDTDKEVSAHSRNIARACPMSAAEVLKAMTQVAFYVAEAMVYLKSGEAGMTTEMLEEVVVDLVLLNSVFLQNPRFYQVFARASVVEELTAPSPPGTLRVGARLLRRMMDMYRSDAAGYNELVLAEELSERLFEARESMPDLKTSWDNLMWNMEFDDDDMESEDLMKSARNAVMAALAERLIRSGMQNAPPEAVELCKEIGMDTTAITRAFSVVSSDVFEKSLLEFVRSEEMAPDGTPTVLFRADPLSEDEIKELMAKAEEAGATQEMALEVVSKEMQTSLKSLVVSAGRSMRADSADNGTKTISDAIVLIDGLARQLVEAFGGTDLTASLDISGQMVSLDEYWASELCFKMVDAVRDPEGAKVEAGIPGALRGTPDTEWETNASRILELMGLGGRR